MQGKEADIGDSERERRWQYLLQFLQTYQTPGQPLRFTEACISHIRRWVEAAAAGNELVGQYASAEYLDTEDGILLPHAFLGMVLAGDGDPGQEEYMYRYHTLMTDLNSGVNSYMSAAWPDLASSAQATAWDEQMAAQKAAWSRPGACYAYMGTPWYGVRPELQHMYNMQLEQQQQEQAADGVPSHRVAVAAAAIATPVQAASLAQATTSGSAGTSSTSGTAVATPAATVAAECSEHAAAAAHTAAAPALGPQPQQHDSAVDMADPAVTDRQEDEDLDDPDSDTPQQRRQSSKAKGRCKRKRVVEDEVRV